MSSLSKVEIGVINVYRAIRMYYFLISVFIRIDRSLNKDDVTNRK